jgi:hypothetical protein
MDIPPYLPLNGLTKKVAYIMIVIGTAIYVIKGMFRFAHAQRNSEGLDANAAP